MLGTVTREEMETATMAHKSKDEDVRYHKKQDKEDAHRRQLPGADDEPLPPPVESIRAEDKPGRNDPCSCGSGKKYKQCCGKK